MGFFQRKDALNFIRLRIYVYVFLRVLETVLKLLILHFFLILSTKRYVLSGGSLIQIEIV